MPLRFYLLHHYTMSTQSTRALGRVAKLTAKARIHSTIKKQTGKRRALIHVNDTVQWLATNSDSDLHFLPRFKRDALFVKSLSLSDGTFVNMYAFPDSTTDIDYILNERASRFNLPHGSSINTFLDSDEDSERSQLVHGPVLLARVDEDGTELGLDKGAFDDLCETHL